MLGAVLFLVAAGGLSLYATGYISELRMGTLAPDSAPSKRAEYISEVERVLGPRGAGGALREFALTRTPRLLEATGRYLGTARQVIGLYTESAVTREQQQGAVELRALYQKVSSLHANAEGLDPAILAGRLEATNAQLAALASALRQVDVVQRFEGAERVANLTQGTVIFAFAGAFVVLMIGALLIRARVNDPLSAVVRQMQDLATVSETGDGADTTLWGVERRDEIGDLARAVARLRQAAGAGRPGFATADGVLKVSLTGPSGGVLDELLDTLRQAAGDLAERGHSLDASREEAAQKAADEIARLSTGVQELESSRRKIDELVSAQRKDLGAVRSSLHETVGSLREAGDQMQAKFEDTLTAFRTRADDFAKTTTALTDTAETVGTRMGDVVSGLTQTQSAVSGLITDTRSINETARSAADVLKTQFGVALEEVRAAFGRLQDTVTTVGQEAVQIGQSVQGQKASVDETYAEINARLIAAADAIDATIGQIGSAQASQGERIGETHTDLRQFGETVANGISQISRSLEQGNARAEGLEHDLARLRVGIEALQHSAEHAKRPDEDTERTVALHGEALGRLETHAGAILDMLKGLSDQVEATRQSALTQDPGKALDALSALQERIDALAGDLSQGLSDLAERATVLPAIAEQVQDLAGRPAPESVDPSILTAVEGRLEAVATGLSEVFSRLSVLNELDGRIAGLAAAAPARDGQSGDLAGLTVKVDGLGESLSEVITQVAKAVDEQSNTAAAVARQQADLRPTLEGILGRIDSVCALLAKADEDGTAVGQPEDLGVLREAVARIEDNALRLAEALETQFARLESGTTGLGESLTGLAQAEEMRAGFGGLEAKTESLASVLADGLSSLANRPAGGDPALAEALARIDARLGAVAEALEPRAGGVGGSIPVDDLRTCIEETLKPFTDADAEGGTDALAATALLQDVVEKLGTLTEKVDDRETGEGEGAMADRIGDLTDALRGLKQDLEARLETMVAELAALKASGGAPTLDHQTLAVLSERIGEEARQALAGLAAGTGTPAQVMTEPVVQSLTDFVRQLKEQGMVDPDQDSLPHAAADIDAVTDVIDVLERRSALLARRIMEGGVEGPGEGSEGLDAQAAIARLQAASDKLGNIATAVAIASDAQRLHATG